MDGPLQGLVPKTKREESELFLGHVQDSCLPEGGVSTLRPLPPSPPAQPAAGTARSLHGAPCRQLGGLMPRATASAGPPPPAHRARAGGARTQVPISGPANKDDRSHPEKGELPGSLPGSCTQQKELLLVKSIGLRLLLPKASIFPERHTHKHTHTHTQPTPPIHSSTHRHACTSIHSPSQTHTPFHDEMPM